MDSHGTRNQPKTCHLFFSPFYLSQLASSRAAAGPTVHPARPIMCRRLRALTRALSRAPPPVRPARPTAPPLGRPTACPVACLVPCDEEERARKMTCLPTSGYAMKTTQGGKINGLNSIERLHARYYS